MVVLQVKRRGFSDRQIAYATKTTESNVRDHREVSQCTVDM